MSNYTIVTKNKNKDKLISVKEFSQSYGLGIHSAYNIVNIEGFPRVKIGTKIYIIKDNIDSWFNDNIGNSFYIGKK